MEQLEGFKRIRLYNNHPAHGSSYSDFAGRLFNYEAIPLYAVINADGEVTAVEANILVFDVTTAGGSSKTPELLQEFLDTTKSKGEAFDFDKGFHKPANAP